ncbi:hypothetical protein CsSME_00002308 [Camellia sinensis var. sinensis]
MGVWKRHPPLLIQLVWVVMVLLLMFIVGDCQGSRSTSTTNVVFKVKPKTVTSQSQNSVGGHFLGFLPKRIPIPASGPSRKHNDIGITSSSSSSSSP